MNHATHPNDRLSLGRIDRLAQILVAVGGIGVLFAPAGWFGMGELNHLHLGSEQWHAHGKFHLLWQGVTYIGLGLASLWAVTRPRSPVRWRGRPVRR